MTEDEAKKKPRRRSYGWITIQEPEDLKIAVVRMINRILAMDHDKSIEQAGKLASLANAWVNVHRLALETQELQELKERIHALEELVEKHREPPIKIEAAR